MSSVKTLNFKQCGFTLVEVIIALALLAIIIAAFTPLLTSSYSGIFRTGRVSKSLYQAQQQLEQRIQSGTLLDSAQLELILPGFDGDKTKPGENPIVVKGQYITGTHDYGVISSFIPKR